MGWTVALKAAGGFLWEVVVWLVKHPAVALCIVLAAAAWHYRGNAIAEHAAKLVAEQQRDAAQGAADAWKSKNDAAVAANATNIETIRALRLANDEAVKLRAGAEQQRERALRDLARARETIRAAEQRSAREFAAIYASDPSCRSWAAAAVCPAVADQLRADEAVDP